MRSIPELINSVVDQIIEAHQPLTSVCLIGIQTKGFCICQRIQKKIIKKTNFSIPIGSIEPELFKQHRQEDNYITLNPANIPFNIDQKIVILIDTQITTGDTMKASLIHISDVGAPKKIEVATLVNNKSKRLYPIYASYFGEDTNLKQDLFFSLLEIDGEDNIETLNTQNNIYH